MDHEPQAPLRVPSSDRGAGDLPAGVGGRSFSGMAAVDSAAMKDTVTAKQRVASPYIVEAIGTFFLVLTITLAGGAVPQLAIGAILMCMIFMGGHISGALYNPAVTLAVTLRGEIEIPKCAAFMVIQVVAAVVAAFVGHGINDVGSITTTEPIPGPSHGHSVFQAFLAEFFYTFALCFVVLSVATVKRVAGNSYFGLAIGFTVGAGAILVGGISGAVFNPAVGTGLIVAGASYAGSAAHAANLWIYWVAPLLAAVFAAGAFRITNFEEFGGLSERLAAEVEDAEAGHCSRPNMAALVMEFIGTFYLILGIALSSQNVVLGAVGIGLSLMVMVFAGGHVSGAMYNPAVTLAVWIRGKISLMTLLLYTLVQCVAATCAAAIGYYLTDAAGRPAPSNGHSIGQAFGAEVIFTFALALVVLNTATTDSQKDNSFFGLAIGFTVLAGAITVGPISGAVLNPAVGTGLTLVAAFVHGGSKLQYIWIYWLAPLIGAAIAGATFRYTNAREYPSVEERRRKEMGAAVNDAPLVGSGVGAYGTASAV